jgi:hypothetical protein
MYSTLEAELDLPSLPSAARRVHIVPNLKTSSLLLMGQLCDAGCVVTFDATSVSVHLENDRILAGVRTPGTGLWHLSLVQPAHVPAAPAPFPPLLHQSYSAVQSATPAELVAFAHATLFSPALSTLQTALDRGFLPSFAGLTSKTLRKHPPQSVAMIKGHLDQTRKNQRSTKSSPLPDHTATIPDEVFPTSEPDNTRTHQCFAAVFKPATGQIHSDQTGKFVVASSAGNSYVLVVYDYDSNSIAAFQVIHQRLLTAGLRPQLHRLDNECSEALKSFLRDAAIDFQLVPPRLHRRNAAERAIRTFKNHFIAGLCSVDKDFPLHLWDKLLPQAELTLNLLRGSRINPKLSAHAQLHGQFDFNRTPLAPPGIRVLVHIKPSERTTLTWFPTKTTMPLASSNDLILAGVHDILQALKNPSPGSPLAPLTDSHDEALIQLSSILTSVHQKVRFVHMVIIC